MIRGYLALAAALLLLLLGDPVQRFVIAPLVRLSPSRRIPVLTKWERFYAHGMLGLIGRIGGAHIPPLPRIEGREGVLILMNHQSVLDIPLVVASLHGSYPRIVTRKRYLRWIPLISHMVRLYQYPVVDPAANTADLRKSLDSLADAARDSDVPLAIFPEGTRTKDGEIGRFRPSGLRRILGARPWTVYLVVADGFWQRAKMKHFIAGIGKIHGKVELLGPFEWTDPDGDADAFIHDVRARMLSCLADMREGAPA